MFLSNLKLVCKILNKQSLQNASRKILKIYGELVKSLKPVCESLQKEDIFLFISFYIFIYVTLLNFDEI